MVEVDLIMSPSQKTFDRTNFCLAVNWDLQINLFKVNFRVFWLNYLSVEIFFREHSKKYDNPIIREFSSELNFVVSISALFAEERSKYHFPEEGNFCHEQSSGAVLLAVHTETLDNCGWVSKEVRSRSSFMSAKITYGCCFLSIEVDLFIIRWQRLKFQLMMKDNYKS